MRFTVEIKDIKTPDACEVWLSLDDEQHNYFMGSLNLLKTDFDDDLFMTDEWSGEGDLTVDKLAPDNTVVNQLRIFRLPSGPGAGPVSHYDGKPIRDYPDNTFSVEIHNADNLDACTVWMSLDGESIQNLRGRLKMIKNPKDEVSFTIGNPAHNLVLSGHKMEDEHRIVRRLRIVRV